MPATPVTTAWPPSLPSVPTSRATRLTSDAKALSWSTIVLMVFFSSRISPFTSTVILRDRSPRATAVATSAMLRTCPVRFDAMKLTLSVRSFQVPATPVTTAWPPSLPSVPTSRATRVTSEAKALSWSTIVLMVFFSSRISPFTSTVIFRERSPLATAVATSAMLRTWPVRFEAIELTLSVRSFQVPATSGHFRLAAELAFGADFARDAAHFRRERVELIDHRVDGVLQLEDFALHVDRDLAREVAVGDGGRDVGDVADLAGQVRRHRVDVVGEVLPGAGDAGHCGLAAELAFGADLARHAAHFRAKPLSWSTIVLMVFFSSRISPFTSTVIFRERSPLGDGGGDVGDVADLTGQVRGHRVDGVGQVLPGAGDAGHDRLAAELAFGADFARHARDFRGKAVQLVDHRVDGVLQLEDLALHVDRDLAREVAAGDRGRHLGDVADLRRQVGAHRVDRVGQVLPGAGDVRHFRLAAELAFGADFARDAGDFRGEGVELIDHRVDGVLQLEDLALHVDRDLARQVAARDRRRHAGDVAHLRGQVRRHRVDRVGEVLPGAGDAGHDRLAAELAFGADFARHARHFGARTRAAGRPSC